MNRPEISVIIVSYNVWEYLRPCIQSVYRQQKTTVEVIVVDNNSTDTTIDSLRKEFPEVKVIANKENLGFSTANNQGISASAGKYILLLNPDTEIKQPDCLYRLSKSLEGNTEGIVAPRLLNTDGSVQGSFWTRIGIKELFLELFYLNKLFSSNKRPEKAILVQAVSGAVMLMEKALLNKIGMLDENMFWMEDIDVCYRVRKHGGKIIYEPEAEIIHHGGKSSNNYSVVIPNQVISKIKFYKKNGSRFQYGLMEVLSLLFIFSRLLAFAILSMSLNDTFIKKRRAYLVALKGYLQYNFTGGFKNF